MYIILQKNVKNIPKTILKINTDIHGILRELSAPKDAVSIFPAASQASPL